MGLYNNDGNGRDTRLNVHNFSVKIVGCVRRQCLDWGVSRFLSQKFTNLQIWPPLSVNSLGLLIGDGWVCIRTMEMAGTKDSTLIICQSKLSVVWEGNIFGWGI